jgi:hypothetical protein
MEMVVAKFKAPAFVWRVWENYENLSQNSRSAGWDLNPGLDKYEDRILTTRPGRKVPPVTSGKWKGTRTSLVERIVSGQDQFQMPHSDILWIDWGNSC